MAVSQHVASDFSSSSSSSPSSRCCSLPATSAKRPLDDLSTPKKKRVKVEEGLEGTKVNIVSPATTSSPFEQILWIQAGAGDHPALGIHKLKLFKESPFFRSAFASPRTQSDMLGPGDWYVDDGAGSKVLHLPSEDPEVLKRFYIYIYEREQLLGAEEGPDDLSWPHLFDLYLFGLKFEVHGLQNATIDASIAKHRHGRTVPSPNEINRLYKSDIKAANFRQLFIDLFTYDCDLETTMRSYRTYHHQFLSALIIGLYKVQQKMKTKKAGARWPEFHESKRSRYYSHGVDNPLCLD